MEKENEKWKAGLNKWATEIVFKSDGTNTTKCALKDLETNKVEYAQHVKVYVMLTGDYCAFHEMGLDVIFDVTNNINFGDTDYTKEDCEEFLVKDEMDVYQMRDAILYKGKYYL